MKLGDIDWDSAPYGSEKLAQFGVLVTWLKEGHYYRVSDDSWARANTKDFEVLATRPKPQLTIMKGIDWSKVHADYVYLVQHVEGGVFTCSQQWFDEHKDELTILAKRPKPQLTKEQIEAVREFVEWLKAEDLRLYPTSIDEWLKQREGVEQ